MKDLLKSYFYWTYPRGSFHYDVMVSLILLFIFGTPWLWNYGDKASEPVALRHPIQVVSDGGRGLVITMDAADVAVALNTTQTQSQVKKALRKAVEPITGDAVFVEYWETFRDQSGTAYWKIWAHR